MPISPSNDSIQWLFDAQLFIDELTAHVQETPRLYMDTRVERLFDYGGSGKNAYYNITVTGPWHLVREVAEDARSLNFEELKVSAVELKIPVYFTTDPAALIYEVSFHFMKEEERWRVTRVNSPESI